MKLRRNVVKGLAKNASRADLGDVRRSQRAAAIIESLATFPQLSFPDAMGSEAAIEGGYRFMNNPNVTLQALHEPHAMETANKARKAGDVIAIHDTTTCKFDHADPRAIGYLNTGKAGFMVHYTLMATLDPIPRVLGIPHVEPFFRDKRPRKRKIGGRPNPPGNVTVRKKSRESQRWFGGIASTEQRVDGTNIIHVADREIDSFETIAKCVAENYRFVFRARVPSRRVQTANGDGSIRTVADGMHGALRREIVLSRRTTETAPQSRRIHPPRRVREASLEFSATRVELERPQYFGDEFPSTIAVNLVRVQEIDAPVGTTAVEWLLFTTEPVDNARQIARVVDIYRARWLIEECNKALKTGCLYEEREFESRDALLSLLGLSLPIACAILDLRSAARAQPNESARSRLSDSQIEVLRHFASRKVSKNPTLDEALFAIAGLGGHMRCNGPPGWQTIQRGMSKLLAWEEGWSAAKKM